MMWKTVGVADMTRREQANHAPIRPRRKGKLKKCESVRKDWRNPRCLWLERAQRRSRGTARSSYFVTHWNHWTYAKWSAPFSQRNMFFSKRNAPSVGRTGLFSIGSRPYRERDAPTAGGNAPRAGRTVPRAGGNAPRAGRKVPCDAGNGRCIKRTAPPQRGSGSECLRSGANGKGGVGGIEAHQLAGHDSV